MQHVWCDMRSQESSQRFVLWAGYVLDSRCALRAHHRVMHAFHCPPCICSDPLLTLAGMSRERVSTLFIGMSVAAGTFDGSKTQWRACGLWNCVALGALRHKLLVHQCCFKGHKRAWG